jgi:hypothetical protein
MRLARAVGLALGLAAGFAGGAEAQFFAFGQNKIHYRDFEWQVLRGPRVDLYYYPAEAELARVALAYAEASVDTLAIQFGHTPRTRIPLIVYASHNDFEQTNLLPFSPPEGLLGVTEFLKGRVALPFRGDLSEFRHTLRHELVHVFQLSLGAESYHQQSRGARAVFPLWWTEGLAELWSGGEDARDEMVLRDLTISGQLPPVQNLTYYTGGLVYPLGGQLHRWLADTYGDWRVDRMYKEIARHDTFEDAIRSVYGRTLEQLNEEFHLAMRRRYYPTVATHEPLSVAATRLATGAVKPAPLPDSSGTSASQVVYLSGEDGYITVRRRSLQGSGRERTLLTAGRSPKFESLHPFYSRLDPSRPGLLLLSSKDGDRDALVVWDIEKREVAGRYQFAELVSILSPTWMPDGRSIVFSGLRESGVSDLFRISLPDGTLEALTSDVYQDLDPSPSPDGTRIVFASDRTAGGLDGARNLFVLDVATRDMRQLTSGPWADETPVWHEDERIYFASGRDGVLNIFSVDTLGEGRRETSAWTGAFDPQPLPQGGLLVGGFQGLTYAVFRYPTDSTAREDRFSLPETIPPSEQWGWDMPETVVAQAAASDPYRRNLTLDFAAGDVAVVPGFGGAQGLAFMMSDMMSDHLLFGSVASFQGKDLGKFFENLNVTGIYLNRANRVNWGLGGFRFAGRNLQNGFNYSYDERAVGAIGLVRYPLSRFTRLEGTLVVEHSDRFDLRLRADEQNREGWIATNYVSWVHDNSLWEPTGPIDGGRLSVTAGVASDFTNGRFDSYTLAGDWRRYLRLGRHSAIASRLYLFYSGGDRPPRVNLGGTQALRGYPYYGYIVGSRAWMVNQELRLPLLRHLTFGTPFGDLRFPAVQGAVFGDIGKAWFPDEPPRATLASYGLSFRMALAPLAVIRFDMGQRVATDDFAGYSLDVKQRKRGFVSLFFGYNY